MPETTPENTAVIESLFENMRTDKEGEPAPKQAVAGKKFEMLPDGDYTGRVYIEINKVGSDKSPNYGRSKYEIKLNVVEGEYKGKMAYNHRVILPHYLAEKPSPDNSEALKRWQSEADEYMRKSDEILRNCGVDVAADKDMTRFALRIAENNRRNPVVHFTMRNGVPYINRLIEGTQTSSDSLFTNQTLPDGNDAPIV